jgi:transcriptional regulator with XRE-family HTH domain
MDCILIWKLRQGEKMPKKSEMAKRIGGLQGGRNQVDFAAALGVPQSRVSEWLAGKRPTAEMCVKLAKFSRELARYSDHLWFLEQAGVTEDDILSASRQITGERSAPPKEGEVYRLPQYRVTETGIEPDGSLITFDRGLLESESNTICLRVDGDSFSAINVPLGIHLLDRSMSGTRRLGPCIGQFALFRYMPASEHMYELGLHFGRVGVKWESETRISAFLRPEQGPDPIPLFLGSYDARKEMKGFAPASEAERQIHMGEIQDRVGADFPLLDGFSIVGKRIGSLLLPAKHEPAQ